MYSIMYMVFDTAGSSYEVKQKVYVGLVDAPPSWGRADPFGCSSELGWEKMYRAWSPWKLLRAGV